MNCSSRSRSDGRIGFTTIPASVAAVVDHRGFVPVRKHERHHAALRHARDQLMRQRHRLSLQRLATHPNIAIDQRRSLRRCFSRLPQGVGQAWCRPTTPARRRRPREPHSFCRGARSRPDVSLHPPHRHRMPKTGRRMSVDRDLCDLPIRCLVRPLHLQCRGSRFGLEMVSKLGRDHHRGDLLLHFDDAHAEQILDERENRAGMPLEQPAHRGERAIDVVLGSANRCRITIGLPDIRVPPATRCRQPSQFARQVRRRSLPSRWNRWSAVRRRRKRAGR